MIGTKAGAGAAGDRTLDTVAARPALRGASRGTGSPSASLSPFAAELLRADELTRTQIFADALTLGGVAFLVFMPGLNSSAWLTALTMSALAVMSVVSAWVSYRARKPARFTRVVYRAFAVTLVLVGGVLQYYSGVFSMAGSIITIGICFLGMSHDKRFAVGVCTAGILGYGVLTLLVVTEVIPDLGVVRPDRMTSALKTVHPLVIVCSYSIALTWAVLARRATDGVLIRLDEALRLAEHRERRLEEANREIEDALGAGIGFAGRYTGVECGEHRLGNVLGRGGFGEVYEADHPGTGARAAVKVLHGASRLDTGARERLLREGHVLQRLRAPNIVTLLGVGELADQSPYLIMERLLGHDLAYYLRRDETLPVEQVRTLVTEVAAGLDAAHGAGIVHRDIKPQNLFWAEQLDGSRRWKILDFGVARVVSDLDALTAGGVIGTPGYMAPEQARGLSPTPASDVFALGVVLYRALTGRMPFGVGPTLRPTAVARDLLRDVDDALALALADDPNDRYATGRELAEAVCAATRGELAQAVRARAAELLARVPWARMGRRD